MTCVDIQVKARAWRGEHLQKAYYWLFPISFNWSRFVTLSKLSRALQELFGVNPELVSEPDLFQSRTWRYLAASGQARPPVTFNSSYITQFPIFNPIIRCNFVIFQNKTWREQEWKYFCSLFCILDVHGALPSEMSAKGWAESLRRFNERKKAEKQESTVINLTMFFAAFGQLASVFVFSKVHFLHYFYLIATLLSYVMFSRSWWSRSKYSQWDRTFYQILQWMERGWKRQNQELWCYSQVLFQGRWILTCYM